MGNYYENTTNYGDSAASFVNNENGAKMAKSNLVHSHDFRLLRVVNGLAMTKTLVNYFRGSW